MDDDWRNWKNGRYDNRYHGVRRHSGRRNKKKITSAVILIIVIVAVAYVVYNNPDLISKPAAFSPQITKIVNETVGNTVTTIQQNPIVHNVTSSIPSLQPQESKQPVSNDQPSGNSNPVAIIPKVTMPSIPQIQPTTPKPTLQDLYTYALKIVNEDRNSKGLNAVSLSMVSSAQNHADDQLRLGYFSHWNSDGVKPYVVYTKLGGLGNVAENNYYTYSYCPTSNCMQNTFDPYQEIKRGENEMMNNDAGSNWGHRDNILNPDHTHVNFGIAYDDERFYFVENFEDNLVDWQTVKLVNNKLIMIGVVHPGYSLDHIDIFSDPVPKALSEYDLDKVAPYDAGFYDQGMDVGMIVPKLTGGYYYPECSPGKTTVTSSDGSSECMAYSTYENNSVNPNSINITTDVSKWMDPKGLHTIYVNLKDNNGNLVQATSLTLEYLK